MKIFWFTIERHDESLQEKFDNLSKSYKEMLDKNTNKITEIQFLKDDKEQADKKIEWMQKALDWLSDSNLINFMDKDYSIKEMKEVLTVSNIAHIKRILNKIAFWLTSESIRSDINQADIVYRSWAIDFISNLLLKLEAISKEIQLAKQAEKDLWTKS